MPAIAIIVLNGLTAALTAAPQITALIQKAKEFFTTMFNEGLITKEQQNALHARVDAIVEAAIDGELPPHWTVEADPE